MRVEPISFVYRSTDRRARPQERRADPDRRDAGASRRASTTSQPWVSAPFGAYLLGQIAPSMMKPAGLARAYAQPEAKTPLRPSVEQCA